MCTAYCLFLCTAADDERVHKRRTVGTSRRRRNVAVSRADWTTERASAEVHVVFINCRQRRRPAAAVVPTITCTSGSSLHQPGPARGGARPRSTGKGTGTGTDRARRKQSVTRQHFAGAGAGRRVRFSSQHKRRFFIFMRRTTSNSACVNGQRTSACRFHALLRFSSTEAQFRK